MKTGGKYKREEEKENQVTTNEKRNKWGRRGEKEDDGS